MRSPLGNCGRLCGLAVMWPLAGLLALSSNDPPGQEATRTQQVLVTFEPKKGQIVAPVTEDFQIEDEKSNRPASMVRLATQLPLSIAILADISNSRRNHMPGAEAGPAYLFLRRMLRKEDQAMLVAYNTKTETLADLTRDLTKLESAFAWVSRKPPEGASAIYDAIHRTIDSRLHQAPGRRWIILVTDGEDNSSAAKRDEIIHYAIEHRVTISVLWLTDDYPHRRTASEDVRQIAERTGGFLYDIRRLGDFDEAFEDLEMTIRTQVIVEFTLSDEARSGSFRRLKVKTKSKGFKVLAPSAYYVIPILSDPNK